jgi:hypothetical protein
MPLKITVLQCFEAEVLGNIAHKANKKRVPAWDTELAKLGGSLQIGEGFSVLCSHWLAGWDTSERNDKLSKGEFLSVIWPEYPKVRFKRFKLENSLQADLFAAQKKTLVIVHGPGGRWAYNPSQV